VQKDKVQYMENQVYNPSAQKHDHHTENVLFYI